MSFEPGDVVRTKAGGPSMTVEAIYTADAIKCIWFVNEKLNTASFVPASIELVPEDE